MIRRQSNAQKDRQRHGTFFLKSAIKMYAQAATEEVQKYWAHFTWLLLMFSASAFSLFMHLEWILGGSALRDMSCFFHSQRRIVLHDFVHVVHISDWLSRPDITKGQKETLWLPMARLLKSYWRQEPREGEEEGKEGSYKTKVRRVDLESWWLQWLSEVAYWPQGLFQRVRLLSWPSIYLGQLRKLYF